MLACITMDALAKSGHQVSERWFHAAGDGDVHAFAMVKALGTGSTRRCRRLPLPSGIAPRLTGPTVRLDVLIAKVLPMDLATVADNIRDQMVMLRR